MAGYNTDGPGDVVSHLCYEGPKQHRRALKLAKYTNYGAWTGDKSLESYIRFGELRYLINTPSRRSQVYVGWNPYNFDPDTYIASFGKRTFGEKAGKHFAIAMKDIWKVTDAMVFMPEWNRDGRARTGQLHVYHFYPWKQTGYATGVQQPENFASITPDNPEFESFYKRLDIAEAVEIANLAERELSKALRCQPKNEYVLKTFYQASQATAALAQAWRDYHLGLLYHNAAKNGPKHPYAGKYQKMAAEHMTAALHAMWKYRDGFFEIYPDMKKYSAFRGKHPKLYLSFVTQEIQNGYHNVVLKPKLEKYTRLWRLSSYKQKVPQYVEPQNKATASSQTLQVDAIADGKLPPVVSLNILPELNLTFNADLTEGGIIKLVETTWMDRSKEDSIVKSGCSAVKYGRFLCFTMKWRKTNAG